MGQLSVFAIELQKGTWANFITVPSHQSILESWNTYAHEYKKLTETLVLDEGEDGDVPHGSPEETDEGVKDPGVLGLVILGRHDSPDRETDRERLMALC